MVEDLLENITLYDFTASDATVAELENGQFETTFTVTAAKLYADGEGEETEADFENLVDIGAFTKRPGYEVLEPADVISFRLEPLVSGEQVVTVTTDEKPAFVGVDPYSKFVDRQVMTILRLLRKQTSDRRWRSLAESAQNGSRQADSR